MKILFYLCVGLILIYLCHLDCYVYFCNLFLHPIDSHHNTIIILELIGFNLSLWWYFWKYLCLNFFRNMSSSDSKHSIRQMDPLENRLLLKSYAQISKVSGFRRAYSPYSCRVFRSIFLQICTS
jgi:hypothetical protein